MAPDRFLRVVRARGIKFAGAAEEGPKKNLVEADEEKQQPRAKRARVRRYFGSAARAGSSVSKSCVSSVYFAVATELRG